MSSNWCACLSVGVTDVKQLMCACLSVGVIDVKQLMCACLSVGVTDVKQLVCLSICGCNRCQATVVPVYLWV